MNFSDYTDFLIQAGADKVEHGQRTLLEHLQGTASYLYEWGNEPFIYLAGLYHSVYGTHDFTKQLIPLSSRHDVQLVIGSAAENLAYLFSAIDRRNLLCIDHNKPMIKDEFSKKYVLLSTDMMKHLMEIEMANMLDQYRDFLSKSLVHQQVSHYVDRVLPYVSSNARTAILKALHPKEIL